MKRKENPTSEVPSLPDEVLEEFRRFIEMSPPLEVKHRFLKMLWEWLRKEGSTENDYFTELITDFESLFDLLDVIAAHEKEIGIRY